MSLTSNTNAEKLKRTVHISGRVKSDNEKGYYIVDKFGMGIRTKSIGKDKFRVKVKVCTSPTFYRWIFGSGGKIKIEGSEEVRDEYREMLKQALESELGLPIERYKKIVRKL